eukprot:jgi/Chlat1/7481/Chrsp60S06996
MAHTEGVVDALCSPLNDAREEVKNVMRENVRELENDQDPATLERVRANIQETGLRVMATINSVEDSLCKATPVRTDFSSDAQFAAAHDGFLRAVDANVAAGIVQMLQAVAAGVSIVLQVVQLIAEIRRLL